MVVANEIADPFTWNQISVLITVVGSVIGGVLYVTRNLDKKLNIHEYEKRHQVLRDEVGAMNLRLSILEERHRKMVYVLEKNGIKEHK